jgi:hypothetical protein
MFPNLEVEYVEASKPAIELEQTDDEGEPTRTLRADVGGWKSEHLVEFLTARLEREGGDDTDWGKEAKMVVKGAYSAEIQSCSG